MPALFDWSSVLAATDFSPAGENSVRTAITLAGPEAGGLSVVYVAESESWARDAGDSMTELLAALRRDLPGSRGFLRVGTPWREIVRLAEELSAEGVVLGSTGISGIERLLLGSTAEGVVRHSASPVLVVREEPLERIRRVLLPVDIDEGSAASVRYAIERIGPEVEIEALHVVGFARMIEPGHEGALPDDSEAAVRLREFLDGLGGARIKARVVLGEPAPTIVEAARDADLVVIATRSHKGLRRALLGSVAEKVVRGSERPVLVVPVRRPGEEVPEREPDVAALEGEVDPAGPPAR